MTSPISLAGEWSCDLDPADEGVAQQWFRRKLTHRIFLPGALAEQGLGNEVTVNTKWTGTIFDRSYFESPAYARYREPGNIKVPFWLQPDKHYVGVAWYRREIDIPHSWEEKRVVLFLERPHWQTRVWLDDGEIGSCDSLSTPHEFSLGANLVPGSHYLTIRVDNRLNIDVGENAHSVTDHTQGNWNGMIGRMELDATGSDWIEDLQIYPDVSSRSVMIRGAICGSIAKSSVVALALRRNETTPILIKANAPVISCAQGGKFEMQVSLGEDAKLWDEFQPALYHLTATFGSESKSVVFGLREIATEGTQFSLNGRKLFLRGTLDCCVFPLTGYPPMVVESWRAIFRKIQAHGLNHVRFHSWCPPEAAFIAGDELGLYFQVECPLWPNSLAVLASNSPAGIGDGQAVDQWAYVEGERILRAYGNHPCFVLMACGNEPGGPNHVNYLRQWVRYFREHDSRCLYTGTSGWPELPENQFHVIPEPRTYQWGDGLKCRLNAQPPATRADYREAIASRNVPIISHEIGQWCAYPPLGDVGKYRGYLKPRNYEIFAESLAAHHMADQASDFLHASGKLQALCYKEEIESALRTPGMGGFQLLGLQDFPGQGTAPIGLLNAFWETKGYIDANEMKRFCNETVLLARLDKHVFTVNELLAADIEIAHFGPVPLEAMTSWRIVTEHEVTILSGDLGACRIPTGQISPLGCIRVALEDIAAPARYKLVVEMRSSESAYANDWDFWLYPRLADSTPADGVVITRSFREALAKLEAGRNVLLIPQLAELKNDIALGFSPIFWNTVCTHGQAPHTLGLLCDPTHPVFAEFPTEAHSNWQLWYLINRAAVMVLDDLPSEVRPLVQVIDDWFTNRKLGLLFEARVGAGKLLVCSVELCEGIEKNPVALQFRRSLLKYASSNAFQPAAELSEAELSFLL